MTISSITQKMTTQDCRARFPYVCLSENLILVKENKTWEEALEHCRAINYELVSVQPGEDHRRVLGYIMEAETNKVGSPHVGPGSCSRFLPVKKHFFLATAACLGSGVGFL